MDQAASQTSPVSSERCPSPVFFVGWEGVDSRVVRSLLSANRLSHLASLTERGTRLELDLPRPALRHAAWTSLATGTRPHEHGILHAQVPTADGERLTAISSHNRRRPAIWNILNASGRRTHIVNWPVTSPAESVAGICVSDQQGHLGSVADDSAVGQCWVEPRNLQRTLKQFLVAPEQLDEITIAQLIPRSAIGLPVLPHLSAACRSILAETATCFRIMRWCLRNSPWDFAACVFPGLRRVHELAKWLLQTIPNATEQATEIIAGCYEHHDLLLGQLLSEVGDVDVLLVGLGSECGDGAHAHGIAAVAGPSIRQMMGATRRPALDVAPTILTLLDAPVPANLTGQPWFDMLSTAIAPRWAAPAVETVAAVEKLPAGTLNLIESGRDIESVDPAIAHLVRLGYTDPLATNAQMRVRQCRWMTIFLQSISEFEAGKCQEAITSLEQCIRDEPDSHLARAALVEVYLRNGSLSSAREQVHWLRFHGNEQPRVYWLAAAIELADRNFSAALSELEGTRRGSFRYPRADVLEGNLWLRLRDLDRARTAFNAAITDAESELSALIGLAATELMSDNAEAAATIALDALAIDMSTSRAHCYLGIALSRLGKPQEALQAFEIWARLEPSAGAPYRWMARICEGQLHNVARANELRHKARGIVRKRRAFKHAEVADTSTISPRPWLLGTDR